MLLEGFVYMCCVGGYAFETFVADGYTDHSHYHTMSAEISCATTVLKNPKTAAAEIDRVLNGNCFWPFLSTYC
jgi:hypothetical protein